MMEDSFYNDGDRSIINQSTNEHNRTQPSFMQDGRKKANNTM